MDYGGMLIGGKWQAAATEETISMVSPSDGKEIGRVPRGTRADIDRAVTAARRAFEGVWGSTPAVERGRLLEPVRRTDPRPCRGAAQIEARDTGKPLAQARADMPSARRYFEFYGGAADKLHGETIPYLDGYQVMILREPRGVTGHIIPWNYPAQMFGRTLAPALAAGNATVLKPAEEACLASLRLAELAHRGRLPRWRHQRRNRPRRGGGRRALGAPGDRPHLLHRLARGRHAGPEGRGENHVPCVLELGGKSPQIVFEDADQAKAVRGGGRRHRAERRPDLLGRQPRAGAALGLRRRSCGALARGSRGSGSGRPALDLDCGPVISRGQQRARRGLSRAGARRTASELARAAARRRARRPGRLLRDRRRCSAWCPETHALAQEEVFGPVLAAIPFDDEADALRIANGTDFGLVAGVWTENGGRQMRVAKRLRVGQVFVNGYGAGGGIELPFGGVKEVRPRPREGLRGAARVHRRQDRRLQPRLTILNLPTTSRAAVLRSFGDPLRIEEVPVPRDIEPGAILVRTESCTICGTDVHLWQGSLALKVDLPVIVGHEMVGPDR